MSLPNLVACGPHAPVYPQGYHFQAVELRRGAVSAEVVQVDPFDGKHISADSAAVWSADREQSRGSSSARATWLLLQMAACMSRTLKTTASSIFAGWRGVAHVGCLWRCSPGTMRRAVHSTSPGVLPLARMARFTWRIPGTTASRSLPLTAEFIEDVGIFRPGRAAGGVLGAAGRGCGYFRVRFLSPIPAINGWWSSTGMAITSPSLAERV